MNLIIVEYLKNERFRGIILGDLTDIFQLLEDNEMNLQSMAGSQYIPIIFSKLLFLNYLFILN